jgi:hypothetical protein
MKMASSTKAAALLLMITMVVFLASLEVGEAIRWKVDQKCNKKCYSECTAEGTDSSECADQCETLCDSMECFFCV